MNSICFGVGIDTARYGHHASFLDEEKRTAAKALHFKEDREGYGRLLSVLQKLRAKATNVTIYIRIDAAGQYADNLIHWLFEQNLPGVSISAGKPSMNKAYRDAHYDKRKADPVESLACARFAVVERPEPLPRIPRPLVALRNVVATLESIATDQTRQVNQLHGLLAQAFPELAVHVQNISKSYCLKLLAKYPTAKKLAAARLESLRSIPHLGDELAQTLHQAAKQSTASATDEVQELLIKSKVVEIEACRKRQAEALKLLKKAWDSLADGPHQRILTIKGIGLQTAAALVAKIVSIERFATDKHLVGYFGIFPRQHDSGTTPEGIAKANSQGRMCSQGNDLVRRLLYTAAQVAVKHNPPVRELFARQMQSVKHYNVTLGHCMAKLLRQVHAVWRKDEDFDPQYEHKAAAAPRHEQETVVSPSEQVVEPQGPEVITTSGTITAKPASGKRPPLNYRLLKSRLEILAVLRAHRWQEKTRRGSQLRGACPFHGADSQGRNFAVNSSKQTFCCHRCGSQGNALDLLVQLSHLPLHEAAWQWIDQHAIEAPLLAETTPIQKKRLSVRA